MQRQNILQVYFKAETRRLPLFLWSHTSNVPFVWPKNVKKTFCHFVCVNRKSLCPFLELNPYLRAGPSDEAKVLADASRVHLRCQSHLKAWDYGADCRVDLIDCKKVARAATLTQTKWRKGKASRRGGKPLWIKSADKSTLDNWIAHISSRKNKASTRYDHASPLWVWKHFAVLLHHSCSKHHWCPFGHHMTPQSQVMVEGHTSTIWSKVAAAECLINHLPHISLIEIQMRQSKKNTHAFFSNTATFWSSPGPVLFCHHPGQILSQVSTFPEHQDWDTCNRTTCLNKHSSL